MEEEPVIALGHLIGVVPRQLGRAEWVGIALAARWCAWRGARGVVIGRWSLGITTSRTHRGR